MSQKWTVLVGAYVLARSPCSHEAAWHVQEPMPIVLGARGSTLRGRRPVSGHGRVPLDLGAARRHRQALRRRRQYHVQGRMSQHDIVCPAYAVLCEHCGCDVGEG